MNLALSRQNVAAGLLAAAVHGLFLLLLFFGLSWQIHAPQPVMAEIWQTLPEPMPVAKPQPLPSPEPAPTPEKQPEPRPEPELADRAVDIALEKKKQEQLEKKKQAEADALARKKAEELKKQELLQKQKELALQKQQLQADEKRRREESLKAELDLEKEMARQEIEQQKRDLARKQAEIKRRETLRQEEEALQRQMMEESLAGEAAQLKAKAAAAQRAGETLKMVERYKIMISDRVRANARPPEGMRGNPEVVFEIRLLPTGELQGKPLKLKASANPAWDETVERSILKSAPFSMPSDRDALAELRNFTIRHSPHDTQLELK